MVDHSRAFIESKDLPVRMTRVDRDVWRRMLSLDEPALAAALGRWIDGRARRALLARRDRMKVVIDGLVKTSGQDLIFIQ